MRAVLLAAAGTLAAIALAAPAQAQSFSPGGPSGQWSGAWSSGDGHDGRFRGDFRRFDRDCDIRDRRHHRRDHDGDRRRDRDRVFCDSFIDYYGGAWAYYNNRSWESDSYNDWWHDRPDRAFPRWVFSNQACDRMWWSGGAYHC